MARSANPKSSPHNKGGRRSGFHTQPENVGPEPAEYWGEGEARRYHGTPKASRIQAELTHSATALGGLTRKPGILLDLGAGGGLSTLSFQALAADSSVGGPPFVIGVDASPAMLATIASTADVVGISVPRLPTDNLQADTSEDAHQRVEIANGIKWCKSRSDLVLADLAQPLPFRRNIADGVLSVSAVQWLLDERQDIENRRSTMVAAKLEEEGKQSHNETSEFPSSARERSLTCPDGVHLGPQLRLRRLFGCLRGIIVPNARLAFQFYPPKGDHDFGARALIAAMFAEGLEGEVVLDFPHKGAAKKWILVARELSDTSSGKLRDSSLSTRPWCALCWPVVAARCALQTGSAMPISCYNLDVQARLRHHHLELALRLARKGRRLIANQESMDGKDGSKIRQRLEQDLHPLERMLACALASSLNRQEAVEALGSKKRKLEASEDVVPEASMIENESAQDAKEQASTIESELAQDSKDKDDVDGANVKRSDVTEQLPSPTPPTKTQLREIVIERFHEVLNILHQAPDSSWSAPSPPLDALATAGL